LESFAKKMLREIDHYATESAPERLADLPANLLEESTWHVASAVKKLSHAMRMAAEHASTLATIKTLKSE
jgi:hypothetical protein